MTLRLTSSAETTLTNKDVVLYNAILIDGITNTDVVSYGFSRDRDFGASALNFTLANQNGKYSTPGASTINFGATVRLVEGIYNASGTLESFNRFKGIVRQTVPKSEAGQDTIEVSALDYMSRLEDLDLDKFYESTKRQIYAIDYATSTTGGVKLMESYVTATVRTAVTTGANKSIVVDSTAGFEPGNIYLNMLDGTTYVDCSNVDHVGVCFTVANVVTAIPAGTALRQHLSDTDTKQDKVFLLDFGYWDTTQGTSWESSLFSNSASTYWFHRVENISPTNLPVLFIKPINVDQRYEDPTWDGFNINYPKGQVILNSPLDKNNFEPWAYFYYYPDSSIYYAEDIIYDMITLQDGYCNTVFTATDLTSTLNTETGASTENLTYNRTTINVDGTTYLAGQAWYTQFNNISTSLVSGNFTVPAGKTISNISTRYGRIILDTPVSSPTDDGNSTTGAKCNVNYTFKTIQATGIRVPFYRFSDQKVKNRLDGLSEFKKSILPPNYYIYCDGNDKFWGKYLQQKYASDYTLQLTTNLQYQQELNTYSRFKCYGESGQPENIMKYAAMKSGDAYDAFASDQPLMVTGFTGDYVHFQLVPDNIRGLDITEVLTTGVGITPPVLWINGCRGKLWGIEGTDEKYWAKHYNETGGVKIYDGFYFHRMLDINRPLKFYKGDSLHASVTLGNLTMPFHSSIPRSLHWDTEKSLWKWIPSEELINDAAADFHKIDWDSVDIQGIHSITVPINYSDWGYYNNNTQEFIVKAKYVALDQTIEDWENINNWIKCNNTANDANIAASTGTIITYTGGGAGVLQDGIYSYYQSAVYVQFSANNNTNILKWNNATFTKKRWVGMISYTPGRTKKIVSGVKIHIAFSSFGLNNLFNPNLTFNFYTSAPTSTSTAIPNNLVSHTYNGSYNVLTFSFIDPVYVGEIAVEMFCTDSVNLTSTVTVCVVEIELFSPPLTDLATADFWYRKYVSIPNDIDKLSDGLMSTQLQCITDNKPLKGLLYSVFEFENEVKTDGTINTGQPIDAIDITGGWYVPNPDDPVRKYDTKVSYTLKYNTDGSTNYLPISAETSNFSLESGETKNFEKEILGEEFMAKRLALYVEDIELLRGFGTDKWIISLVELSCWKDLFLTGEAKLIPKTNLTAAYVSGTTLTVKNSGAFPSSGTAYLGDNVFTYTGKTTTTFTGCTGLVASDNGTRVSQYLEEINSSSHPRYGWIYDPDHLLANLGDRVYKDTSVYKYLNTTKTIKDYARNYLRELSNSVNKCSASMVYRPDMEIGDSVTVVDSTNLSSSTIYFVENFSISNDGIANVQLSRYADYNYL